MKHNVKQEILRGAEHSYYHIYSMLGEYLLYHSDHPEAHTYFSRLAQGGDSEGLRKAAIAHIVEYWYHGYQTHHQVAKAVYSDSVWSDDKWLEIVGAGKQEVSA